MARQKATASFWFKPDGSLKASEREASSPSSSQRSSRISTQRQKEHELRTHPKNTWKPLRKASSQPGSLFFRLPIELRREIYLLVLAPSFYPNKAPDEAPWLSSNREYLRSGLPHLPLDQPPVTKRRIFISFLLTCRQIYNEAAVLSVSSTVHTLSYRGYGALSFPIPLEATKQFNRMVPWQLASVRHLHVCAVCPRLGARDPGTYVSHSVWAELGCLRLPLSQDSHKDKGWHGQREGIGGPFPREVTVTIRGWGWVWRSRNTNIETNPGWMLQNKDWTNVLGGVETLRVQMEIKVETPAADTVRSLLPRIEKYVFEIGGQRILVHSSTREWTHKTWSPDNPEPADKEEFTEFTIVEVAWRAQAKQDH